MKKIVLETNCLLMSLPRISPYRKIWDDFLKGKLTLCVTNEIIEEYLEIIVQKTNANIASNVVSVILSQKNVEFVTPYYKLHLIQADEDDNSSIKGASQKIQSEKPPYHIGPNLQVYTTGRHDRLPLTSVRERNSPEEPSSTTSIASRNCLR